MKNLTSVFFSILFIYSLFFIEDCKSQWIQTNGPYGNGIVRSFAVLGTNIFGGSYELGIFRSTNNGDFWTHTSMIDKAVQGVYGSGTTLYVGTSDGGYKTTDYGQSFIKITELSVNNFFINGTKLFAGTADGIYVSTNYGQNWTTSGLQGKIVNTFHLNGNNLYAGLYAPYASNAGVYLSTDNGVSWASLGLENKSIETIISYNNNLLVLGSDEIYFSTNNGTGWIPRSSPNYSDFSSIALSGSVLYAGTYSLYGVNGNIYRSTDFGLNWYQVHTGAPGSQYAQAILTTGSNIFIGYERVSMTDIYRSTDNGVTWTMNNTGILYKLPMNFASLGTTVFTGTYAGGIYKTTNNGDNWVNTSQGLPDLNIWSLATSGSVLLAGVGDSGIYRSTNNGVNWVNCGIHNHQIEHIVTTGNDAYFGGLSYNNQDGVFKSTNNGLNWIGMGLDWQIITALAVSGNYVFAGVSNSGIYRTSDNGNNWTLINNGLTNPNVTAIEIKGTNIFAGTQGNGVFLSTNNGNSWTEVNTGLPNQGYCYIYSLKSYDNYLFAGMTGTMTPGNNNVLFMSTNNGSTWINKCQGLDTVITCIYDLLIVNNNIFAATRISCGQGDYGKSVWRRSYNEIIGINKISSEIPSEIRLHQNYPNPFNPATTIKFDLTKSSYVNLGIFDVLGKKIATLVNGRVDAGYYSYTWDASGYPSGLYFYRLKTDDYTYVKKMLLVK